MTTDRIRREARRPRYPRANEFPQYPHNQEKTMFEKLKALFNRTAPDGPTYDEFQAEVEQAKLDAVRKSRREVRRRKVDAVMAMTDGELTRANLIHDRAEKTLELEDDAVSAEHERIRLARLAARRKAEADLAAQAHGQATARGTWDNGEARRKEALRKLKQGRGRTDDRYDPAAFGAGFIAIPDNQSHGTKFDATFHDSSGSSWTTTDCGPSSSSSSSYDSGSSGSCDSGSSSF